MTYADAAEPAEGARRYCEGRGARRARKSSEWTWRIWVRIWMAVER